MLCRLIMFVNICIMNLHNIEGQEYRIKRYIDDKKLNITSINHLLLDSNQNIWVGSNAGLYVFNGLNFIDVSQNLRHSRITFLFESADRNICAIDAGFNFYNIDTKEFKLRPVSKKNSPEQKEASDNSIGAQKVCPQYTLSSNNKVLKKYLYLDSTLVLTKIDSHPNLTSNFILSDCIKEDFNAEALRSNLIINNHQKLLLLKEGNVVEGHLRGNRIVFHPIINKFAIDRDNKNLHVGLFIDKINQFFFGSMQHGIFQAFPIHFNVLKPNLENTLKYPNSNLSVFYSQVKDENQNILVNNHLSISKTGEVKLLNIKEYSRSLNYKDIDNNIWLGSQNNLKIIHPHQKVTTKLTFECLRSPIIGMCELNKDMQVITTLTDIIVLDHLKLSSYISKESLGLQEDEDVNYIFKGSYSGEIYLLSNQHIYFLDINNCSLQQIKSLGFGDYRIMQAIHNNLLFLGTYGQGFFMFNGENWMPMPLDKHGYLKYAHAALCDTKGHLWISTNNGLFRTRLQDIEAHIQDKSKDVFYYYYDKDDGFLTNEFNGGCQSPAIVLSDGRFSFSSMNGLVQFDPLKVPAEFPNNAIQIINLWLNGIRKDTIPCNLVLDQDISNIKFEVSTSFFGHPDNLILQYKLDGIKGDWQNLNEGRYIYLQNLKYGTYFLNIRKRNYFGSDAYDVVKFQIQILPRYYETTWFYLMISLLTILLFYGLNRWYYRFTIQKNKDLDALVKLKNKDLIIVNEQLVDKIKQNDLFQSILVHDIRTPIRFISSNARLIAEHWNGLNENIKKNNLIQIYESTERINSFVEETLFWIQLRNGNLKLKITNFYIYGILKENIRLFEDSPKLKSGNIVVVNDCDHQLKVNSDQMLVSTIIRNLLINSIKYTNNGQITLYAFIDRKGKVNFGCKDEGTGIPLDLIEIIMQDDYKGNSINSDRFKMGFVIIKELVKMLNAKLCIKTNGISGTDISITL